MLLKHFTQNYRCKPHGIARGEVRESVKSARFFFLRTINIKFSIKFYKSYISYIIEIVSIYLLSLQGHAWLEPEAAYRLWTGWQSNKADT